MGNSSLQDYSETLRKCFQEPHDPVLKIVVAREHLTDGSGAYVSGV